MTLLYYLYQLFIAAPLLIIISISCSIVTYIGCSLLDGRWWGYYPAKIWCWLFCKILLLPVKVEGRGNIDKDTSYVFVANHQGSFDIFLVFGFLDHQFRWMMKKSLERIPLIGFSCRKAKHIFVDQSSNSALRETMEGARDILQGGLSVFVFPEGTRTYTGKMGKFHKGGFLLADHLQLPIVPVTLNGPFDVLPRTKGIGGFFFVKRCPMTMIIHKPIYPSEKGRNDVAKLAKQSYDIIKKDLIAKYQ